MRPGRTRLMFGVLAGFASASAPALDFTLGLGPVFECQGDGPALRAASLALLEPTAVLRIREYGARTYDPESGENLGVGVGYADVTAPVGQFCLGAFYRNDYVGQASKDALDALVANRAGRPFDVGRTYDLEVESTWLESAGLKLSYVYGLEPGPGWSLQLGVTASLMKALSLRDEALRGVATATSGDYAVGTARLTRSISDYPRKEFNPYVGKADPDGYGFAADIGAVLQSAAGWVTEFTVMDAYSRLDWEDVPQSVERADNQTIRYDANLNREAFVQGVDRRVNLTQPLEPRFRLSQDMPLRRGFTMILSDDYVYETHFPAIAVRRQWSNAVAELGYDTRTHAVSADWRWAWLTVSITSNDVDFGDATVLGAGLQFASRW
jgi:hypothetical protein